MAVVALVVDCRVHGPGVVRQEHNVGAHGVLLHEERNLADVLLGPGGAVALVYWSGESLLCGYPTLEARLRALEAGA